MKNEMEKALNRGTRPSRICDMISVKGLDMGEEPPHIEVLEIGDLANDRMKGIFRITYNGDANLTLQTRVQANPLITDDLDDQLDDLTGDSFSRAATYPLVVPLEIHLSKPRIRGLFVLSVSTARGILVSFKNIPLESLLVSSSFDHQPSIRDRLQSEIMARVSALLVEDLPRLLHLKSLGLVRYLSNRLISIIDPKSINLNSKVVEKKIENRKNMMISDNGKQSIGEQTTVHYVHCKNIINRVPSPDFDPKYLNSSACSNLVIQKHHSLFQNSINLFKSIPLLAQIFNTESPKKNNSLDSGGSGEQNLDVRYIAVEEKQYNFQVKSRTMQNGAGESSSSFCSHETKASSETHYCNLEEKMLFASRKNWKDESFAQKFSNRSTCFENLRPRLLILQELTQSPSPFFVSRNRRILIRTLPVTCK